ncbi:MAG: TrmH family RNA methyltransferase [Bacteroidales bacterium]|jgi:23S rRNA (guanosine2251-2'-O)-methyltransferase|nr:TrmH family RNA methyltransferase [Bacteroidales bacterium]
MAKRTIHSNELFNDVKIPKEYNPPIIVAYNIKTPENIGNIIRLAGNSVCKEVLFVTKDENIRSSKIKKTASSAYNSVNWSFCNEVELKEKIPSDYKWIAIETSSDSENIYQVKLPNKIALFVGNEINGIDSVFLDKCHEIVHIPLLGNTTSMNVSHALAVALFEWQRQIYN